MIRRRLPDAAWNGARYPGDPDAVRRPMPSADDLAVIRAARNAMYGIPDPATSPGRPPVAEQTVRSADATLAVLTRNAVPVPTRGLPDGAWVLLHHDRRLWLLVGVEPIDAYVVDVVEAAVQRHLGWARTYLRHAGRLPWPQQWDTTGQALIDRLAEQGVSIGRYPTPGDRYAEPGWLYAWRTGPGAGVLDTTPAGGEIRA